MPTAAPELSQERRNWHRRVLGARGRPSGIALTLVLSGVILFFNSGVQQSLRMAVFDTYQREFPRQRINDGVVVVGIDDASLNAIGRWPWPRSIMAQLVEQLAEQKPAAIGIAAVFPESDTHSVQSQAEQLDRAGFHEAAQQLLRVPDLDDGRFADAIRKAPVALGVSLLDEPRSGAAGMDSATRILGNDAAQYVPGNPGDAQQYRLLRSIDKLDQAAKGHGLMAVTTGDGTVRRIPCLVDADGAMLPALPLEILRLAAQSPAIRVSADSGGVRWIQIRDRKIRTDKEGQWWLHFSDWRERPTISAAEIIQGTVPPAQLMLMLQKRILLLGYTAKGQQDIVTTPVGPMSGVDVMAEAMDNFIDNRLLSRPDWANLVEALMLAFVCAVAITVVPWLRPAVSAGVFLAAAVVCAAGCAAAFVRYGLLLDSGNPIAGGVLVYTLMFSLTMSEIQAQRRRLRAELNLSRESQARLEGELGAAHRIQTGMLPVPAEVLGSERRVAVAARMIPARSVGGDLYDFFMLDESRLFLLIGDVSGKGLPASLFMALSKALAKGAALRNGGDPARTLQDAGTSLSRENPEFLFVTVAAIALNLNTGELAWSSAGHEPPWLLPAGGGGPRRLEGKPGPPLCVVDGFPYSGLSVQLAPGDCLCLITDGVTEAQDESGAFFGSERAMDYLGRTAHLEEPEVLVEGLAQKVLAFAGSAEQADDVCILCLRWLPVASGLPKTAAPA